MKLSTAIRNGVKKTGKARMAFYKRHGLYSNIEETCAVGAAMYEVGGSEIFNTSDPFSRAVQLFPILIEKISPVREYGDNPGSAITVGEVIIFMNDHADWSRERLADWVEQIEMCQDYPNATVEELSKLQETVKQLTNPQIPIHQDIEQKTHEPEIQEKERSELVEDMVDC